MGPEELQKEPKKHSVVRSASVMAAATFCSRILGLVREQTFAYLFGAGVATDAFNTAFRIPNLLRDLFAEGAMSAALVPVFTKTRKELGDRQAWRVAGLTFRTLFIFVSLLSVIGIIFSPDLVSLFASSFRQQEPGKFELTITLTRELFPFFPLVALAAAFMAVLNACGVFFIPAFSSALFNLTSIIIGVSMTLLAPRFGRHPIEGMALGVIAGGVIQAFSQVPALLRCGYRFKKKEPTDSIWYRDPALRRILLLMLPGVLGLAATQVNILVNTILATSQGTGAVSWLNFAFRLMQFPIGIFGVSLAAATLPRVSQYWVERDMNGVENTLTQSLRNVFAVNLPAACGLAFLSTPIIGLIYQHGRFSASDTEATAMALTLYAVGLASYSADKIMIPVFYAIGKTPVAVFSSVLSVGVNITLNLLWIDYFGYKGLALGTSCAAIINSVFLLLMLRYFLRKAQGSFSLGPILRGFFLHLVIALTMGVCCWWTYQKLKTPDPSFWTRLGTVVFLLGEGGMLVLILARVFRASEIMELLGFFRKKLKIK